MSIIGFKTAKGSIYAVDDAKDGRPKHTTRLKVSFGKGHGEMDKNPSLCLFVSEAGAETLGSALVQSKHIIMLYNEGDKPYQPGERLIPVTRNNAKDVPIAKNFFFGVLSPQNEWENLVSAYPEPKAALRPMEQGFEEDGTVTNHLGNPITELYDKPSDLMAATVKATQTLAHTASRKAQPTR